MVKINLSNDWQAKLSQGLHAAQVAEAKGAGSIVMLIRDFIRPYIGMRTQEGAVAWRVESDDAMTQVIVDINQIVGTTTKGLDKESLAYMTARNNGNMIRRAVTLYRACDVLGAKTGTHADWEAKVPAFPAQWFIADDATCMTDNKRFVTHYPMSGKSKIKLAVTGDDGSLSFPEVTISEAAINSASKPKVKREASETAPSDGTVSSVPNAIDGAASALAAADYVVAGDAADAFLDMIRAYAAASESNRGALAAIVAEANAQKLRDVAKDGDAASK